MNSCQNIVNVIKRRIAVISITLVCFISAVPAHAGFRKALDAYIARDGDTMLKEVKDAVDKKNDDGLMLLLMATNMDAATSDYDETTKQSKSTLRAILPQPKWNEMRELLVKAANNSTVDAQYYLLTKSVFKTDLLKKHSNPRANDTTTLTAQQYSETESEVIEEYVNRGSKLAMLHPINNILIRAEAGDPEAQFSLGMKYLNYKKDIDNGAHYGCQYLSKEAICQTVDEAKGNYWIKRAAKSYELRGHEKDAGLFASQMCEFLHVTARGDKYKLKQAYLWAVKGMNEHSEPSKSWVCLRDMYDSTELKIAAPEVYMAYTTSSDKSKFNALIYQAELKQLPDQIVEIRKELAKEQLPVFTYSFNDDGVGLEIYMDGRVFIRPETMDASSDDVKDTLMQVSAEKVKKFLSALNEMGFNKWTMADTYVTGFGGRVTTQQIVNREKVGWRRMDLVEAYLREFSEDDAVKNRMNASQLIEYKKIIENHKKSVVNIRIAKIKTLVEEYFPTKQIRCELGNSEQRKQQCIQRDIFWTKIAEQGE